VFPYARFGAGAVVAWKGFCGFGWLSNRVKVCPSEVSDFSSPAGIGGSAVTGERGRRKVRGTSDE